MELRNPQRPARSDLVYWHSPWAIHARQSVRRTGSRPCSTLATRLFPAFSAMPSAKVCSLTEPSPAVWLQPVDDHRRAQPADRGWCGLGALVNGGFGWRATSSAWPRLAVLSLLGILAWLPRLPPAAHLKDDLASRLNVWSTHSSSLLARLL